MQLMLEPFTPSDLAQNPSLRDAAQLLNSGKIDDAQRELKAQATLGLAGAESLLVAVYYQQKRFDEVIAEVTGTEALRSNSSAWTFAGSAYLARRNPTAGFAAFRRALLCDWQNLQAHRMAWTALDDLGLLARAHAQARSAIEKDHMAVPAATPFDRPDLSPITLCAVDCVYPSLAARALRICAALCRFGAVKLLTSSPYYADGIQTVAIPHLGSTEAYSAFVLQALHRHIDTEYALLIQWDGYVLSPQAWENEFLNHDYIGARWLTVVRELQPASGIYDVGNGGFSLRSKKFLAAAAKMSEGLAPAQLHPEDGVACQRMRPKLEARAKVRFASGDVADRFSMEHAITGKPTFGFHGVLNLALAIRDPAYCRFEFLNGLA